MIEHLERVELRHRVSTERGIALVHFAHAHRSHGADLAEVKPVELDPNRRFRDHFPAVKRDLALLLDKKVQFAEIEKIAYETEKKLLKEVSLFDVYEGKNLEVGKKSYAVSFLLQDENATLNDKQIDKIMSKLVKNLEDKLNAKLR